MYRDRYQEALRDLIEAKMKGLTVKPRKIAAPPPVIDLIAALKRSLAQEAPASERVGPAPGKAPKAKPDRRGVRERLSQSNQAGITQRRDVSLNIGRHQSSLPIVTPTIRSNTLMMAEPSSLLSPAARPIW